MKIAELKNYLAKAEVLNFILQNGKAIPDHFHITEVGMVSKHFFDCGGQERLETVAALQLYIANDTAHRLLPAKFLKIISSCEKILNIDGLEIEVEYQTDTIGKYGLGYNGEAFVLLSKQTACLASGSCGITSPHEKKPFSDSKLEKAVCAPVTGCC